VIWVGGEGGMEERLVRRAGVAFEAVPAAGLHGIGLRALPGNLSRMVRGVVAARRVIRRFGPDVLFFTGGYVAAPVAIAGRGIPSAVYIPDIEPGLALRFVSRGARLVALTAEEAGRHTPRRHTIVTGYPTRPGLVPLEKAEARRRMALDPSAPVLLVTGGSRGARSINRALWDSLPTLLERTQVLHITGELDWPEVDRRKADLTAALSPRYHAHAYLHEEMGAAFAAADLAVTRAGASVLGELPLFGLPAILVPYPHAWRYQEVNADYLAGRGAAVVLRDEDLPARLGPMILDLLEDPSRRSSMAEASRRLARPGAAHQIAAEIERLAREERRPG
jgi:UDP-N-acetylglucosamine--N-acetylmuramyl-(pentapeptide) pyrophosphoryl-undecaprenol N-acetylglucosamine transferase